MSDKESVVRMIHAAFDAAEYPGDAFLQGSTEGCEPFDEIGAFIGKKNWASLQPEFLDAHYAAPSFFSEAGFRFFLPAYLIADLNGQLKTADPVFHLTHGFSDDRPEVPIKGQRFTVESGKSAFVNPRRYGASTFYDYARYRLSVFTREEAGALVAYLEYRRNSDPDDSDSPRIRAALDLFWRERAATAPLAASLAEHEKEKKEFMSAVQSKKETK